MPRWTHHVRAQDVATIEGGVEVAVDGAACSLAERPLGPRIVLRLDSAKPSDRLDGGFEWLADQVVDAQPARDHIVHGATRVRSKARRKRPGPAGLGRG